MGISVTRDNIRVESIRRSLEANGLDALVCALPHNVLLLSGQWPMAGTVLAIATREGRALLIDPSDEMDVDEREPADEAPKRRPETPGYPAEDSLYMSLRAAAVDLAIEKGRVGYEQGPSFVSVSAATMRLCGANIVDLLRRSLPIAKLMPADGVLARLRATPTPAE